MSRTGIYDPRDGFIPDDDCPQEKPKQTNIDRIRSLPDEELADFLCDISGGESCTYCVASDLCHNGHNGMIEWLKKEVEGETDEDKA